MTPRVGGIVIALVLGVSCRAPVDDAGANVAMLSRSIDYFEHQLARDPRNPMLASHLAHRLVLRFGQAADLADLERAEDLARIALALANDRSAALTRLSGLLLMQHKFQPAFDAAAQAVAADTGSHDARGSLLEAAIAVGRYDVADREAGQLDQSSVSDVVRRAMWLDQRGETRTALALMEQSCRELAVSARPQVVAWCLTQAAGMVHTLRGPDEARAAYRRALAVEPGYRGAEEGLANLAMGRGNYREAIRRFRGLLSSAHPDLYLRLADALRAAGDSTEANRAEHRFLAIAGRPDREPLFGNVLALYYAERGDRAGLDSALAIATREVRRRPTIESYDLLGWVHYRRGELKDALAASDRSLGWGSPTPTMSFHRATVLLANGRTEESRELMAGALATPTLLAPHVRRLL